MDSQLTASHPSQSPPTCSDAVQTLADKIAISAAPARTISLEIKNMSSVESSEVGAIQRELESSLKQRQLPLAPAGSADASVRVTLSEGAAGRILIAEIRRGNDHQIALVSAPSESVVGNGTSREELTLAAKLVWKQRERFLDFALYEGMPGLESTLLIVESGRLVYYRSTNPQWQLLRTIHIPESRHAHRDVKARVVSQDRILLTQAECSGNLLVPDEVHCTSTDAIYGFVRGSNIPGHEGSLTTTLAQKCNGGLVILASGTGDWTQPDALQAFGRMQTEAPPTPAGNAINFDGPILTLAANGQGIVARAIVHNLMSGDYEAYLVTATCSH